MAEEATRRSDQLKTSESPERIFILEEEIERSRREASATIQELKSKAASFVQAEVRDKVMKGLAKTEKAAEKTAEAARRQSIRIKEGLSKVDKRTAYFAAGGILAAGSLLAIFMGKRRKPQAFTLLPEERVESEVGHAEDILEEAKRESIQADREHIIVTPAQHYREEAELGQSPGSSRILMEEDLFEEVETESTIEEERKKSV